MKYYVIEEIVDYGSQVSKPLCVVEKEEIAKDVVKRYIGLTYFTYDTKETKMNKELANLQDLKSAFVSHCKTLGCEDNYIKVCENKFDTIETALKNYGYLYQIWNCKDSDTMIIQTTKTIHDENNKKLEALEIIKKHIDLEDYDAAICMIERKLTQEEFDLLKEILL